MNNGADLFLRQKVHVLTGLTKYDQLTSSAITLTTGNWVDLVTAVNIPEHIFIWAYQISLSSNVTEAVFRIIANNSGVTPTAIDKIFPFSSEVGIISGTPEYLHMPLHIPRNYEYAMQVKLVTSTAGTPTATLDYASIVKVPALNYSYNP
jgi:hypothetical protein